MGTTIDKAQCQIIKPDGSILNPVSAKFDCVVNQGIQWSADFTGINNFNWGDEDTWIIKLRTNEGLFTSCPLVALQPKQKRGISQNFSISGTDLLTHRMNTEGLTQRTYSNVSASTIMTSIATAARVTIAGAYSFPLPSYLVQEYDVQGFGWGHHLVRLARDGGYNWRINPSSGVMEFFPINAAPVNSQTLFIRDTEENIDLASLFTRIRLRKTSKLRSDFQFTATPTLGLNNTSLVNSSFGEGIDPGTITASDESSLGFIQEATFFDAGNQVCRFIRFDNTIPLVPQTSSNPATTVSWLGHAPTFITSTQSIQCFFTLHVHGSPHDAEGYDFGGDFLYPQLPPGQKLNDLGLIKREKVSTLESPLWPTNAFIQSIAPLMLQETNKNTHTVTRTVKINPFFMPGEVIPADYNGPAARYDSMSWSVSKGAPQMTLKGWVQTPLPLLAAEGVF